MACQLYVACASQILLLTILAANKFQDVGGVWWTGGWRCPVPCARQDLALDWRVSRGAGETFIDVQWLYRGTSQEVVAVWSHGHLLVTPAYSGRVALLDDVGLRIRDVSSAEAGNYTVEINVRDANGPSVTLTRTAAVVVGDGLMTSDGALHALQMSAPVWDEDTRQWSLGLACGHFTYHGQPPFSVVWTTPSGGTLSGVRYEDGQFVVHVAAPVQGGAYTCSVPRALAPQACIHGNGTTATVTVDATEARLELLEAKVQACDCTELSGKVGQLEASSGHLSETVVKVRDRFAAVVTQVANVTSAFHTHLGEFTNRRVYFTVSELHNRTPNEDEVLKLQNVRSNQGGGYNNETGKFVAPYSGAYFFAAVFWAMRPTTSKSRLAQIDLVNDDRSFYLTAFTHIDDDNDLESFSLAGTAHLKAGEAVWLRVTSTAGIGGPPHSNYPVFTGFLVSYDP